MLLAVGEFESRALLVPNGCRFGHVDERQSCEPFDYWQSVADDECGRHTGADARTMRVRSFAVIDACGLAKFKSVEFVCCPQTVTVTPTTSTSVPTTPKTVPKKPTSSEQRASKSDAIEETVFDKDKKKSARKTTKKTKDVKDLDDDEDDEEYFDDDKDEDDDEYDEKKADEIIMGEIRNEDDVTTTKGDRVGRIVVPVLSLPT
jgi:amyloid beta A4 protein